ncbi:MAG: VWA domain-containing protein [Planctomycetes bacterium]|nr:VWA domain-containing protein [Planctomycetota bacterium]
MNDNDRLPRGERHSLGQLLVTINGKQAPLALKSHRVKVTIRDQIAYTLIDEEFENHTPDSLEGAFLYPVPPDAAVWRFAVYNRGSIGEGRLAGVAGQGDALAGMLHRGKPPTTTPRFKAPVPAIEPRARKRVIIGYAQVLRRRADTIRYTCPLKTNAAVADVRVEVDVYSTPSIADLSSRTPDCLIERIGNRASARFFAKDHVSERDLALSYRVGGPAAELCVVPQWRERDGGYFLAFLSPRARPAETEAKGNAPPANALLMVDSSGSMSDNEFACAMRVVSAYLDSMHEDCRFNILLYDVEPRLVFPEFVDNFPEFRELALGELAKVRPLGASDLGKAIAAAAEAIPPGAAHVVYIGDGIATIGETDPARLLKAAEAAFAKKNVTALAFAVIEGGQRLAAPGRGNAWEPDFVEGLARRPGGAARVVSAAGPVEEIVAGAVEEIAGPMITDLSLSIEGADVHDLYPAMLPNVPAGGQVIVAGRYRQPGRRTVVVKGSSADGPYRREIVLDFPARQGTNEFVFVPRVWARRRMNDLLRRIAGPSGLPIGDDDLARKAAESEVPLIEDVRKLSLAYEVLSPYTSFLFDRPADADDLAGLDYRFPADLWAQQPPKPGGDDFRTQVITVYTQTLEDLQGVDTLELLDDYLGTGARRSGPVATTWEGGPQRNINVDMPEGTEAPAATGAAFSVDLSRLNASRGRFRGSLGSSFGSYIGSAGRRNRYGLYEPLSIPEEAPERQPPEVEPDVREVMGCFARGPFNFRARMKVKNYGADGKVQREDEITQTVVDKRFSMDRVGDQHTSRTFSDGELYYRSYEKLNYAAARKATSRDLLNFTDELPGMIGCTVDWFLQKWGVPKIESREGDVAILVANRYNSKTRYFVDTARKVVTKIERHYKQDGQDEFSLSSYETFDKIVMIGHRPVPTRRRDYRADGTLQREGTLDIAPVDPAEDLPAFVPPAEMLVVVYPLPSVAEAKKAAEKAEDADRANFVLALALEADGMFEEAGKALEKVRAARPDDVYLRLYGAWLANAAGDGKALDRTADKIIAEFDERALAAPGRAERERKELYYFLSIVHRLVGEAGRRDDQETYARRLFELSPKGSPKRTQWGREVAEACFRSGTEAEGMAIWRKVVEEAPQDRDAWRQMAQMLTRYQHSLDGAEEAFLKARELGANIGTSLADHYAKQGEPAKALAEFRRSMKKRMSAYDLENLLRNLARFHGPDAVAAEAKRIIAEQEDPEMRKQAMLGYLSFAIGELSTEDTADICRQLMEQFPGDATVLGNLLQRVSGRGINIDLRPAIERVFQGSPKDAAEANSRLRLLNSIAQYGFQPQVAELMAKLEHPKFDKTRPDERNRYLLELGKAQRTVDPEKARETFRSILAMDPPAESYTRRSATDLLIRSARESGDTKAAQEVLLATVSTKLQGWDQSSIGRELVRTLWRSKKYDELITLHSALQEHLPDLKSFHQFQVALAREAAGKERDACDTLQAIMRDAEASLEQGILAARRHTRPGEPPNDPAYYFYQAGRMLIRLAKEDAALEADVCEMVTPRAQQEKPGGSRRWTALLVELLRADGRFDEMIALLEKLAGEEKEGVQWQRQLAAVYAAKREYSRAEEIYRKIVEQKPDDLGALLELSRLSSAVGRDTEALDYWQKFLDAMPNDEQFLGNNFPYRLRDLREHQRQIAVLEKLLSFTRDPGNYARRLAEAYEKLGRRSDAALAWVKATRTPPRPSSGTVDLHEKVWPLITDEDTFNKFTAALEKEVAESDRPERRARLMALMAEGYANRKNKDQAVRWARKAMLEAPDPEEDGLDTALAAMQAVLPAEEVLAILRGIVDEPGRNASEPLRVRLVATLFAAGQRDEAERAARRLIDTSQPAARHKHMLVLAGHISGVDHERAVKLLDEVAEKAQPSEASRALLKKAQLMAESKKYPAAEVVKAYRAAATTGPKDQRKAAAEAMLEFAKAAKQHEAVIEAYQLAGRSDQGNVASHVRQLGRYLRDNKLQDGAEEALRKLMRRARPNELPQAYSYLGRFFADNDDYRKAVEVWAEGRTKCSVQNYGRRDLVQSICRAAIDERTRDKVDRQMVRKLVLDEVDLNLTPARKPPYGWQSQFLKALDDLALTDEVLAKIEAVPQGRVEFAGVYGLIGEFYTTQMKQPDKAAEYFDMAAESASRSERASYFKKMVDAYKKQEQWQKALECADELVKLDDRSSYERERGVLLAKLGRTEQAQRSFEEASRRISHYARDYRGHQSIAESAIEAGLHDFAIREIILGLSVHDLTSGGRGSPDYNYLARSCKNLASCYREKGEKEKAIKVLLAGAGRVSRSRGRDIRRELKEHLGELDDLDAFIKDYEQTAEETGLENTTLRAAFGDILYERDDKDQALEHYGAVLEFVLPDHEIRSRMIETLRPDPAREGELTELYRKWATLVPNSQSCRTFGRALERDHGEAEAMRAYSTMVEALPNSPYGLGLVADALIDAGRFLEAVATYKDAIALQPELAEFYSRLARRYLMMGRRDEAVAICKEILKKKWGNKGRDTEYVHRTAQRELEAIEGK